MAPGHVPTQSRRFFDQFQTSRHFRIRTGRAMKTLLPLVAISSSRRSASLPPWEGGEVRSTAEQVRVAARAREAGIASDDQPYNVLVLNYTMQCPLACDFCCYSCGPHRTETMDKQLAVDLIGQAADLEVFGAVAFTGGEPFTFYDELVELSEVLSRRGLQMHVITACGWATGESDPAERLRPLVANGLTRLAVSHDPSHRSSPNRIRATSAAPRKSEHRPRLPAPDTGARTRIWRGLARATDASSRSPSSGR